MKRQLTSILLFSALLMGGASTFVSCTDHESDAAYEVTGSIADQVKKQATELENLVTKLDFLLKNGTTPEDVKNNLNQTIFGTDANGNIIKWDNAKLDVLQQALAAAKQEAEKAKNAANSYTDSKVEVLAQQIVNLDQAISTLRTTVENNTTELNQLNTKVDNYATELQQMLENCQAGNTQMFNNLTNLYNDMDVRLQEDENRIANLEEAVRNNLATKEYVNEQIASLNTKIDGKVDASDFNAAIEAAKAAVLENKNAIAANKTEIDKIKNELVNYATKQDLDDKAASLEAAFKAADKALETKMQAQIDDIKTKLNKFFNTLINMLTGIELQATESPITGYENFSFLGAEAHILGTYYGTAAKAVSLGGEDIADEANQVLIDKTSGENAGVIYATLNPSNVDFTGCTFKVVNSQGEEAPFTATVVKSNRVLKYGVSRASNSNLYAIKINLSAKNLEAAKTWTSSDAAALKDVAQNVLDKLRQPGKTRLNIGDAASTIARTFNNRLTAYALQAEQKYTDANGEEQTRTITSKMSLAATAIKPVSYNFLADNETLKNLDLPSFPTIQSKINFNDYKFNWKEIEGLGTVKTSVTLKGMPDLDNIKVTIDGEVKAPKVDVKNATVTFGQEVLTGKVDKDGNVTIDLSELQKNTTANVEVEIGNIKIDPKDVKVTLDTSAKKDMTYDVEIPMDEFNKIIDNINNQVGNMIGNVNGIVDKVQNYAEIIDGRYITGINNYIQKFENLLRKSNSLLQPAMFFVTSGGSWGQLARESEGASYLKLQGGKASTVLVASSYTGEIFAPAYKKYVHVTDAPDGAHVTGVNLNKVIDGNLHKIGFEADKAGTYEITYEAVDYSGFKVAKKFYVKVVK